MMTAITLTDEGPDIRAKPSKLWSSREELQRVTASQHPSSVGEVPIPDILDGVQRVATARSVPPKSTAPRSPPIVPISLSTAKLGTLLAWQKQSLTRPSAARVFPHRPALKTRVKAALEIIKEVERDTRAVFDSLRLPDDGHLTDFEPRAIRTQLQDARGKAQAFEASLHAVKLTNEPDVQSQKDKVLKLLDNMHHRIRLIESVLPPPPAETGPVMFDSCKFPFISA
jgi:hypothetical protein